MRLSDDALRLCFCHFFSPGSALRFGASHAAIAITPRARAALDELLQASAVKPTEPDGPLPGREHYEATDLCLRKEFQEGTGGNVFNWIGEEFVTFEWKGGASDGVGGQAYGRGGVDEQGKGRSVSQDATKSVAIGPINRALYELREEPNELDRDHDALMLLADGWRLHQP
ncbi:MAG: hypothetical protein AAF526_03610 [Pseudomonadota bacterium]